MTAQQKTGVAQTTVGPSLTAQAMGSGDLAVFATPALVALLEQAATVCIADQLPEGYTTVGTRIETSHVKASALGATITAKATLLETNGKSFTFQVEAYEDGQLVGSGSHTRVMVNAERFMGKLKK